MTEEKKQELFAEGGGLVGGILVGQVLRTWLVKRALSRLAGREYGWKDAYLALSLVQIAAVTWNQGVRGDNDLAKKVADFKAKVEEFRA